MAVSPQGGPVSAKQFLDKELAELGKDHPSYVTIELAAGINSARTSPLRMERDLREATSGHLDIVQKYMDKLAERHFLISRTPSPDDKVATPPAYPGLNMLEVQIVRKYEIKLIEERLSAAGPIFDQYAKDLVTLMEVMRPIPDSQKVSAATMGPNDYGWMDTHPREPVIVAKSVDSVSHIATPARVSVRPQDSAIKVVLSDVVEAAPALALADAPQVDKWSEDMLIKSALRIDQYVRNTSGKDLFDFLSTKLVVARQEILIEIQSRAGQAPEAMLNHMMVLDRQIVAAKEKLSRDYKAPAPVAATAAPALAPAAIAAAAPVAETVERPKSLFTRAVEWVKDLFNPYKPVDDLLAKTAKAPVTAEDHLAAASLSASAELAALKPKPFEGLRTFFANAALAGTALKTLVRAEVRNLSFPKPSGAAVAGVAGVAGLALVGSLTIGQGSNDSASTERVATTGKVTTTASLTPTPTLPTTLVAAHRDAATAVAAIPAAAVLSAPEPEAAKEIKEVKQTSVRKAFHIESIPTPQPAKPTTVTFADGSTYVSPSGADTWNRMCEKGFDICKSVKNLTNG